MITTNQKLWAAYPDFNNIKEVRNNDNKYKTKKVNRHGISS